MKKQKDLKKIEFRLKEIDTVNYSIYTPKNLDVKIDDAYFIFKSGFKIDYDKQFIITNLETMAFEIVEKKEIYCKIELLFLFHFKDMKIFKISDKVFRFPDEILRVLMDISYSTTRGILYEKWRGTYLDKIILPSIDINSLIPKNKIDPAKKTKTQSTK